VRLGLHTLPKTPRRQATKCDTIQKKSEIIYSFFCLQIFCKINKFVFSSEFTYIHICQLILSSLFIRYFGLFYWHILSHLCKSHRIKNPAEKMAQKLKPLRSYRRPELSSNTWRSAEPDISRLCHLCPPHPNGHIAIYIVHATRHRPGLHGHGHRQTGNLA